MKTRFIVGAAAVIISAAAVLGVQQPARPAAVAPLDVSAILRSAAPDLDKRVARFVRVEMPFNAVGLSARDKQMVEQLVKACQQLERAFWQQSDPEALKMYEALAGNAAPAAVSLRRLLMINGSRWDFVDDNRPFVGTQPMPPGHALYPPDMTAVNIDAYVSAHPDKKPALYNPYTIVRRQGPDLVAQPYHEVFRSFMDPAAAALRRAADLSSDPAFAKFLRLRAAALGTDDYYDSDIVWLGLENPKFDVIFAPYETYLDELLGVKTSYGPAVLIRNDVESRNLARYQRWVPDIQDALPLPAADRPSKRGHATPMEVMDAPFRAGDLRHGYQAVADNLPNDPRIHKEKGSKKVFFKNFLDARTNNIVLPLAARMMDARQARLVSADGYLIHVLLHEICHGLGPAFARRNGRETDIREAIGATYAPLEESKADVVGMFAVKWLADHGVLEKRRLEEYYASYAADLFRTTRLGGEAHGRGQLMQFNFYVEQGAIVREGNRYRIAFDRIPIAIERLSKELLDEEATGDRARTEAWFRKYGGMPAALKQALASANDVPVDIDPVFSFPELP